jgi:hypothetical protein
MECDESPITTLPLELLVMILKIAAEYFPSWVTTKFVCHQWREVHQLTRLVGCRNFICGKFVYYSVREAHITLLEWAKDNGCPFRQDLFMNCVYNIGAKHGKLQTLQWLGVHNSTVFRQNTMPIDGETWANAAYSGNLELLEWLLEIGCPRGRVHSQHPETLSTLPCSYAAGNGQSNAFDWLVEHGFEWDNSWDMSAYCHAARNGHLEMLNHLLSHGKPAKISCRFVLDAAYRGHTNVLEWGRDHSPDGELHHQDCISNSINSFDLICGRIMPADSIRWCIENNLVRYEEVAETLEKRKEHDLIAWAVERESRLGSPMVE